MCVLLPGNALGVPAEVAVRGTCRGAVRAAAPVMGSSRSRLVAKRSEGAMPGADRVVERVVATVLRCSALEARSRACHETFDFPGESLQLIGTNWPTGSIQTLISLPAR